MTLKNLPIHAKDRIVQLAAMRAQTTAEWVANMVERQAGIERGDMIEAGKFERKPEIAPSNPDGSSSVADIAEIIQAAAFLAQTKQLRKAFRELAEAELLARLQRASGFAPAPINGHAVLTDGRAQ